MNKVVLKTSSSDLIWWLIADCDTLSSSAANLKLNCLAAASKARNALSGGNFLLLVKAVMGSFNHVMALALWVALSV